MQAKTKTRKIFKLGKSVCMTIPKDFCDKTGLKPGDRVGVVYDSVIIIATPQKLEEKQK